MWHQINLRLYVPPPTCFFSIITQIIFLSHVLLYHFILCNAFLSINMHVCGKNIVCILNTCQLIRFTSIVHHFYRSSHFLAWTCYKLACSSIQTSVSNFVVKVERREVKVNREATEEPTIYASHTHESCQRIPLKNLSPDIYLRVSKSCFKVSSLLHFSIQFILSSLSHFISSSSYSVDFHTLYSAHIQ